MFDRGYGTVVVRSSYEPRRVNISSNEQNIELLELLYSFMYLFNNPEPQNIL